MHIYSICVFENTRRKYRKINNSSFQVKGSWVNFYFPFTFTSFPNIFIMSMNYFQVTHIIEVK